MVYEIREPLRSIPEKSIFSLHTPASQGLLTQRCTRQRRMGPSSVPSTPGQGGTPGAPGHEAKAAAQTPGCCPRPESDRSARPRGRPRSPARPLTPPALRSCAGSPGAGGAPRAASAGGGGSRRGEGNRGCLHSSVFFNISNRPPSDLGGAGCGETLSFREEADCEAGRTSGSLASVCPTARCVICGAVASGK